MKAVFRRVKTKLIQFLDRHPCVLFWILVSAVYVLVRIIGYTLINGR